MVSTHVSYHNLASDYSRRLQACPCWATPLSPLHPSAHLNQPSHYPNQPPQHLFHPNSHHSNHQNHSRSPRFCAIAYSPASSSPLPLKFRVFHPFWPVIGPDSCSYMISMAIHGESSYFHPPILLLQILVPSSLLGPHLGHTSLQFLDSLIPFLFLCDLNHIAMLLTYL